MSRASFVRVSKEYQLKGKVSNLVFLPEQLFMEEIVSGLQAFFRERLCFY
jgi:hypothetical protein